MLKREGFLVNNNSDYPSIIVGLKANQKIHDNMQPLFNGIEEEKIPVTTQIILVDDIVERAYKASLASRLSVGIAIEDQRVIVHYKNLKPDKPLFDDTTNNKTHLRMLGANAARLVKGIPFKKQDE